MPDVQRTILYVGLHHAMGIVHGGLAVAILVGGIARFPPPTYTPLLELTDGRVWPLGCGFALAAILMATQRLYADIVGMLIGIAMMSLMAILFAIALVEPGSAATAFVAYGGYVIINTLLLCCRAIDWTHRERKDTVWTPPHG